MKSSAAKLIPQVWNKVLIPTDLELLKLNEHKMSTISIFYQSGWIPRILSRLCLDQAVQLGCLRT